MQWEGEGGEEGRGDEEGVFVHTGRFEWGKAEVKREDRVQNRTRFLKSVEEVMQRRTCWKHVMPDGYP